MSCDNEFDRYLSWVTGDERVTDVFGTPERAKKALSSIYTATNNRAASEQWASDKNARVSATAGALLLFGGMRNVKVTPPLKPPTHAKNGMPTAQTAFGYDAVYKTIQAVKSGGLLPQAASNWLSVNPDITPPFESLVGDGTWHDFYGVDNETMLLNNSAYQAVSTEELDYCSSMSHFAQKASKHRQAQTPLGQVQVAACNTGDYEGYTVTDQDGHEWVKFGTDKTDEWYSSFDFQYNPKPTLLMLNDQSSIAETAMGEINAAWPQPSVVVFLEAADDAVRSGDPMYFHGATNSYYSGRIADASIQTDWAKARYGRDVLQSALQFMANHPDTFFTDGGGQESKRLASYATRMGAIMYEPPADKSAILYGLPPK